MEEEKQFKVIILFLAHKGVTQPDWWNMWREYAGEYKNDIIFKVHSPLKDDIFGKKFCDENSIGFYDSNSEWCQPSLVTVYLECVKSVTIDYPNSIIYLVSGYDIPFRPARYMFETKYDRFDGVIIEKNPKKSKICGAIGDKFMSQWLALNSIDALKIYNLAYTKYRFLRYRILWYMSKPHCPDEKFILDLISLLRHESEDKNISYDDCITSSPHPTSNYHSPREWDVNVNEPMIITDIFNGSICTKISLKVILYYLRYSNNNLFFFRKIANNVDLSSISSILVDDTNTSYDKFLQYYEELYKRKFDNNAVLVVPCPNLSKKRIIDSKIPVKNSFFETMTKNKRIIEKNNTKLSKGVENYIDSLKEQEIAEDKYIMETTTIFFIKFIENLRIRKDMINDIFFIINATKNFKDVILFKILYTPNRTEINSDFINFFLAVFDTHSQVLFDYCIKTFILPRKDDINELISNHTIELVLEYAKRTNIIFYNELYISLTNEIILEPKEEHLPEKISKDGKSRKKNFGSNRKCSAKKKSRKHKPVRS